MGEGLCLWILVYCALNEVQGHLEKQVLGLGWSALRKPSLVAHGPAKDPGYWVARPDAMFCWWGGPGHLPRAATALLCSDPDFQPIPIFHVSLLALSVDSFQGTFVWSLDLFLLFYFFEICCLPHPS